MRSIEYTKKKNMKKMRESINGQFNLHREFYFLSGFCLQIKQDQSSSEQPNLTFNEKCQGNSSRVKIVAKFFIIEHKRDRKSFK